MKFRIEDTNGDFLCDLDMKDLDVEKLLQYAVLRLQKDPDGVKYDLPLRDEDITKLIEYAITSILHDELKKEEKKKIFNWRK